jgi:hypothetical protein
VPKGVKPPNAGKGRPKGSKNKFSGELKEMILQALANAGGVDYLHKHADSTPTAFLSLVGRVLPLQVKEGGDDPKVPVSTTIVHKHS